MSQIILSQQLDMADVCTSHHAIHRHVYTDTSGSLQLRMDVRHNLGSSVQFTKGMIPH